MDSCINSFGDSLSPFDTIIFDLDDTLYSGGLGFGQATKRNIDEFLVEKCGFPESKASSIRIELFKTYGSTLAGLRALGYDISSNDYHGFVHGKLPYHLIKPDPQLRKLLQSIKQRKIIFTNSDNVHAMKVLNRVGLADCFEQIICFETMNPNLDKSSRPEEFPVVLKPSLEAMKIAIETVDVDPRRTLFFDDNARNIAAGKAVGLRTVLVGRAIKTQEADYAIEEVSNLMQIIPEIWYNEENDPSRSGCTRNEMELDSILASTTVVA